MKMEDMVLDVEQHIEIKGSPEKVFAAVLHRFGKGNIGPDGQSLQLELEPKAGGRWYRRSRKRRRTSMGFRAGN